MRAGGDRLDERAAPERQESFLVRVEIAPGHFGQVQAPAELEADEGGRFAQTQIADYFDRFDVSTSECR